MTQPVRFSHLRAYGRSAMHGWHARTADEADPTRDMQRGTAVHAIVFGTRKVLGYPGAVRRGKEYDAFVVANPDCEILTMSEYDKACRMADAVRSCKLAEPYLQGIAETTVRFRWMGLECRATPDVNGAEHLTELKTSSSAEPVKFTWHALRMAYHAQMRFQQIGTSTKKQCLIVCVESDPPHPVTVFELDKQTLEIGERLLILWAERLKTCEASGTFPPYAQSIFQLVAPVDDMELDYEGT